MLRQYELVDRVRAYDDEVDEALLDKAYVFAMRAHGSQKRHSGDPYFSHPIEVAGILTEIKLDSATVATGLLHDTVEDTLATQEEINELFGEEVGALVDGVTKITQLEFSSEESKQAENFRKLMVAMSRDVRVILVKLADRLHNMRTLQFHPKEASRKRIAQETLDIFAPLAGRMGMQDFREELEDLSFAVLYPEQRETILKRLAFLGEESEDLLNKIKSRIEEALEEFCVEGKVFGRQKRPYSAYRKLQRKEITFEQLSDMVAFRIIVEDVNDCYRAMGALHQTWKVVPGRFKDYISIPKSNGYQSIHTTVIGPEKQRVEIQIRTSQMHDVAERGVAAHWLYKERQHDDKGNGKSRDNPYRFLSRIGELLEHGASPEEFLEHTKLEMFLDQVFCFTPKGELIALPMRATPIDFAYAVHTYIGDHCVGAKVNGQNVPLNTELRNGDSVEILTSEGQKPQPFWEDWVATGKARSAIRRYLRDAEWTEFVNLGREIIAQHFEAENQELTDKGLEFACHRLKLNSIEEIYYQVGKSNVTREEVLEAVYPGLRKWTRLWLPPRRRSTRGTAIPIRGLQKGLAVHLASCCHPIPGDRIVGIRTQGKGVDVHIIDCATLDGLHEGHSEWIDLTWDRKASGETVHIGRIRVVLSHERGALGAVCTRIGEYDGNITNLRLSERSEDFHEAIIDIQVANLEHLTQLVAALRASPFTRTVKRVRGAYD